MIIQTANSTTEATKESEVDIENEAAMASEAATVREADTEAEEDMIEDLSTLTNSKIQMTLQETEMIKMRMTKTIQTLSSSTKSPELSKIEDSAEEEAVSEVVEETMTNVTLKPLAPSLVTTSSAMSNHQVQTIAVVESQEAEGTTRMMALIFPGSSTKLSAKTPLT